MEQIEVSWHGLRYRVGAPPAADRRTWVFVTLEGLDEPPPGDAVLVFPGRSSMLDLFGRVPRPESRAAVVERLAG